MYKFERLTVWNEALVLAQQCYKIGLKLPRYEQSGLSDQLRRASTSVLLNIAEGSGSDTDKDFSRFLVLSRKSLFETVALLKFIEKVYNNIPLNEAYNQADLVGKLLNGLIKKLKSNS